MKHKKKLLSAAITLSLVLGVYGVAGATELYGAGTDSAKGSQYLKADGSAATSESEAAVIAGKNSDGNQTYVTISKENAGTENSNFTVTGGTWGGVYGGYGEQVEVYNNNVTISGDTTITISGTTKSVNVKGGYANKSNAYDNTLTINGGTLTEVNIYGGQGNSNGYASRNKVTISDGTINANYIYGGYSAGNADNNHVNISGGTINITSGNSIAGGYSYGIENSSATNNEVNISGGTITGDVCGGCGGKPIPSFPSVQATYNTVNISGGTITGNVYGGYSEGEAANGNTVNISGGTVTGDVYGGYSTSGTVSNNTVNISGTADVSSASLYGYSTSGTHEGNTLNIGAGWSGSIKSVKNFENVYINASEAQPAAVTPAALPTTPAQTDVTFDSALTNIGILTVNDTKTSLSFKATGNEVTTANLMGTLNFYIPATAKSGDTMLTVAGTADLTGATINTSTTNYNGDTITLISADTSLITDSAKYQIDGGTASDSTVEKAIDVTKTGITNLQAVVGYNVASDNKSISFGTKAYQLNGEAAVSDDVTLTTTLYNTVGKNATLNLNNQTINMQQASTAIGDEVKYSTLTVGTLSGSGKLAIDADLAGNKNDKLQVTAGAESGTTLDLSSILVRSDSAGDTGSITYVTGNGASAINYTINANGTSGGTAGTSIVAGTSDYTYTFSLDPTNNGNATFTRTLSMTLSDFITGTGQGATATAYTLTKNNTFADANALTTNRPDGSSKDLTLGINEGVTLSGVYSEGQKANGIIIANGYNLSFEGPATGAATMSGFTTALTNNTGGTLNVSNITFADNTTDIDNSGTATLRNVVANTIANNGELTIAAGNNAATITGAEGTLTFGNGADNVEITNNGPVTQKTVTVADNAKVTNKANITATDGININASGALITAANNIDAGTKGIANNGSLTLTGDSLTLASNITGTGTTTINGTITSDKNITNVVTINADKSLSNSGTISGAVTNYGSLTTTANGITGGVTNNSALSLTEGTLASDISGSGTTTINGAVTSAKSIANAVTINAGKSLSNSGTISGAVTNNGTMTTTANGITGGVTNNSALTLTEGTLASDISGSGTTTINGAVTSAKSIANAVTINAGKSLTNSGTINGAVTINAEGTSLGSVTNSGTISGIVTNNGTLTNTGTLSGQVTNSGTMTTTANGITGGVKNNNVLNLTGGALGSAITSNTDTNGTLNINDDVALGASVSNQNIIVAAGKTLTANNSTDYLNATDNLTLGSDSTLNMKSATSTATYNTLTVGTLTANDAKLSFDLAVNQGAASDVVQTDKIVATTATGTLTLDSVNVTADLGAEPTVGNSLSFTLVDSSNDNGLTINGTTTATSSGYRYAFTQDATDKGMLTATKDYTGSLADIIQNRKDSQSYDLGNITTYSLVGDYATTDNLGTLTRVTGASTRSFTINGNNHTLSTTATDKGGVTVNSGDTLNLKNITISGFATAVTNNSGATVNIDGVTFTSATDTADIVNNGTINVSGQFSGSITNNNTINWANTATVPSGGELTLSGNGNTIASQGLTSNGNISITGGTMTVNQTSDQHSFVVNGNVTTSGTGKLVLNNLKGNEEDYNYTKLDTAKNKITGTLTNNSSVELNNTYLTVGKFEGNNLVLGENSKFLAVNGGTYKKIEVEEDGEAKLSGENTVNDDVKVKGGTLEITPNEEAMSVTTVEKDLNLESASGKEGIVNVAEGAALVVKGNVHSTGTINVAGTMAAVNEVHISKLDGQNGSSESTTGTFFVNAVNVSKDSTDNDIINIKAATDIKIKVAESGETDVDKATNMDAAIANVEKNHIESMVNLGQNASFNMNEGLVFGETSYVNNGSGVQKTTKANTANSQVSGALSSSAAFNKMEANDIRKRIGDVRLTNVADGIWTRFEKGQLEGSGVEHGFNKYQIGADHKVSDKWRVGGAFSYTKGTAEYARGENNVDTFSLAGYGVYTGKNGEYADIIGRLGVDNTDMDFYAGSIGSLVHQHGKLTTASMALSGEIGKTYMMKSHFFVEPQAELMYTHTTGDNFTSNGVNYDLSSVDSLQGRLGFAFGYQAPDKSGVIYTRISALHEFGGRRSFDASNQYGSEPNYSDGVSTWWEWAVGGQINLSKATYFYADIEKTWGATMDEKYRATAGFRFSF